MRAPRRAPPGAVLALALAIGVSGCVAAAPDPDPLTAVPVDEIREPPADRSLRHATVRVRNLGCGSFATGSGVVVDDGLIATNRHVVDGTSRLEINTWDGRTLEVDVAAAASRSDLALVRVTGALPPAIPIADSDLAPGDEVAIAGYPGGRRLTIVTGEVRDVGAFSDDEIGDVALVDAPARPGNSGGPVGNHAGELVGLVYAATTAEGDAVAIPASRLAELRAAGGFAPVAPCDESDQSLAEQAAEVGVGQATLPPAPTPTVARPCPAGRPDVAIADLDATERPDGEPAWDVRVAYRLTNGTDHPVSVGEVEVTISYEDGSTSTHGFEGTELSPGEEATVERTVAAGRPDAPPARAQIAMGWRWADDDVARRCPADE
ncbi:MAG TPA: serine protease [Acidimicrobiales bacterium]|nr:serine protease [Acidimicrobiales bacterium]